MDKITKKIKELEKKLEALKQKPLSEFEHLEDDEFSTGHRFGDHRHMKIYIPKPLSPQERKDNATAQIAKDISTLEAVIIYGLVVTKEEKEKKRKLADTLLNEEIPLIEKALVILERKEEDA